MSVRAELQITDPSGGCQTYVMRLGDRIVFGRGQEVDLHLDSREVSRRHLQVELRKDGVYLTDLGSSNGTRLGIYDLKPNDPTLYYGGETVRLGEFKLAVRMLEEGQSSEATGLRVSFLPRDQFEVLGVAGRGGMSTVWAARQILLDREVAIKTFDKQLAPGSEDHQRFLREARLYTEVRSPYVVELYDIRVGEGTPYLILELVRGPTALARLLQGAMRIPEVLTIGEELARALAAIHAAGIVHRDVKPGNVLLTIQGIAKLGDFGLAKSHNDPTITALDLGMGSLSYVSPEQARSAAKATSASDLYGLGATLYHLLSGEPPFVFGDDEPMVLRLARLEREQPAPLRKVRSDCPPELARLVDQLLLKDSSRRPGPADRLADILAAIKKQRFPGFERHGYSHFLEETWGDGFPV
jgi:serine/threonine protein kinase